MKRPTSERYTYMLRLWKASESYVPGNFARERLIRLMHERAINRKGWTR